MSDIDRREQLIRMLLKASKADNKREQGILLSQLGESARSVFDYPKAMDFFKRELEIWKEAGNKNKQGDTLRRIGRLLWDDEDYEQAKRYYNEAVEKLKEADAKKELGMAWTDLGKICEILGEFQDAISFQKKSLEISLMNGDKYEEILNHRFLGDAHTSLGEYDKGKTCYDKALAVSKMVGDKKGEAFAYSGLRSFYRQQKKNDEAADCGKKAIEIYSDVGDLRQEGIENCELGDIYFCTSRFKDALEYHTRSLLIRKQIGDKKGEAQQYGNLGVVHMSLGDHRKGEQNHKRALEINIKTNHLVGQGVDYSNLGSVYQHRGEHSKAYSYYKKALEINIRTGNQEATAAGYRQLGICRQNQGKYEEARKLCETGSKIASKAGYRNIEASILSDLAKIYSVIGESEKAKDSHKRAAVIFEKVGNIAKLAETLANIGTVYQLDGDKLTAMDYLTRSLDIMKGIESRDMEASALAIDAGLHSSFDDHAKATPLYNCALKIAKETENKRLEIHINSSLGMCYAYTNQLENALLCFKKALSLCEMMDDIRGISTCCCNVATVYAVTPDLPNITLYLEKSIRAFEKIREALGESEDFKIGFADKHGAPYQLMIAILIKLGNIDHALSVVELVRARSLAELMVERYSAPPLPDLESSQLIDFHNVVKDKNTSCVSFCFVQGHLFCWTLRAKKETMLGKVKTEGFPLNIRPKGVSTEDWVENLSDQCYRQFSLLPGEQCEDRLLFLQDREFVERSPAEPQKSQIAEQSKNTCQVKEKIEGGSNEEPPLKLLHEVIIAPVADFLEGPEIIVVPDRSLYRVPFSALMNEKGEYLAEKFRIRYTPSLTTLKLIQDSPADYHSETGVLLVGDPDVGILPRLPKAKEEAEMIGKILNVQPLTGKEATKEAVLQKIHSVSLIHIAAHGEEERGNIALAPSNPEKDDFLLTMADISAVRVRAKLVVLSCCHSGKGHIKAEGVVGIARAFLGSGARSVLASLWAVDDEATMEFMKQFYEHLVDGKSASECLHETMKWMRENPKYSEVRKWAPFVLIGDDVSFKFSK